MYVINRRLAMALCGSALVLVVGACGSGGATTSATGTTTVTAPDAPSNVVATAGDGSASVAFTAPSSNGGSAISAYSATCIAGSLSKTATGAASPIVVSGLTNGTIYNCGVTATNSAGTSAASHAANVTPILATGTSTSTAPAACAISYSALNNSPKVNATSIYAWTCTATLRTLSGNGIPDHPVTTGNFATPVGTQTINVNFTTTPVSTGTVLPVQPTPGYALNSVKFDPGTDGSCASTATGTGPGAGCVAIQGRDPWRLEAIGGAFAFGTDESNAHVQPNGQYHYHGMPEGMLTKLGKGTAMTLVGFMVDGFPVYARYGYTVATSTTSGVKVMKSSYRFKATPDAGRPSVTTFPMGTFTQDYEYVAGLGDLDECNGRTGVTPEFPGGIYHYYVTDSYPYIQRCVKGK